VLPVVVLETFGVTVSLLEAFIEEDTEAVLVGVFVLLAEAELVDDNVDDLLCVVVLL
jgi:hypothetical protein